LFPFSRQFHSICMFGLVLFPACVYIYIDIIIHIYIYIYICIHVYIHIYIYTRIVKTNIDILCVCVYTIHHFPIWLDFIPHDMPIV